METSILMNVMAKQTFECNGNIPVIWLQCIKGEDSADVFKKIYGLGRSPRVLDHAYPNVFPNDLH